MEPRHKVTQIQSVAESLGLFGECQPLQQSGMVNDVWMIGDRWILRAPRDEETVQNLLSETVVLRSLDEAEVYAPKFVAFDNSRTKISVPALVYDYIGGETLGSQQISLNWETSVGRWFPFLSELATQLAQLHHLGTELDDPHGWLNPWWVDDPMESLHESAESGHVSPDDANWCERLIVHLGSAFDVDPKFPPERKILVHHDLHPWNILVDDRQCLSGIIDWGNSCLGDPAIDFSGLPLWALPPLVEAYRQAGGLTDETFEGRVLWYWLSVALREPLFLNPSVFKRHWWRLPEDGVRELRYRYPLLAKCWRNWFVN